MCGTGEVHYLTRDRPDGGIGRRRGLKIPHGLAVCEFESRSRHEGPFIGEICGGAWFFGGWVGGAYFFGEGVEEVKITLLGRVGWARNAQ